MLFRRRCFALSFALFSICGVLQAYNPSVGDFSRSDPAHVRLLAWNTHGNFIADATRDDEYQRILQTLSPDIIAFEEMPAALTAAAIQTRLDAVLPLGGTSHWTVFRGASDGTNRNVLASRRTQYLQITDTTPVSDARGVTAALIDLSDATYAKDIYVMAIHLKCCSGATETARRQKHCDAIAKWFGDIRTSGGAINLAANTPVVVMGDFNLVDPDPQQPEVTLRTGAIQDTATYGSAIKGDWDVSDITDVRPQDPYTANQMTWSTAPGGSYLSSRLDRFYFTDATVAAVHSFVLNTANMTVAQRAAAGLQLGDSAIASDHFPIVIDLAVPQVPVTVSAFEVE